MLLLTAQVMKSKLVKVTMEVAVWDDATRFVFRDKWFVLSPTILTTDYLSTVLEYSPTRT